MLGLLERGMRRGALLTATAGLTTTALWANGGSPAWAAACDADTGVTVVVDTTALGGSVAVRCATGSPGSGLEALTQAGFVVGTSPQFPGFVCTIDGLPDDGSCPGDAYWGYFYATDGSWKYSSSGAAGRTPPAGSWEGWAFQNGPTSRQPGVQPDNAATSSSSGGSGQSQSTGGSASAGSTGSGSAAEATPSPQPSMVSPARPAPRPVSPGSPDRTAEPAPDQSAAAVEVMPTLAQPNESSSSAPSSQSTVEQADDVTRSPDGDAPVAGTPAADTTGATDVGQQAQRSQADGAAPPPSVDLMPSDPSGTVTVPLAQDRRAPGSLPWPAFAGGVVALAAGAWIFSRRPSA